MQRDAFKSPGFVIENFDVILSVADGGYPFEVGGGIGDILVSRAVEGGNRGGAEAEVFVAYPVAFIVAGTFSVEGVV